MTLTSLAFGTKAETLERVRSRLKGAKVLQQFCFTANSWNRDADAVLREFHKLAWAHDTVIVRSSALAEDASRTSLAGHYVSVANVCGESEVRAAIQRVCHSYNAHNPSDQVFIQSMLKNVGMSGVAFTKDPNTGGPYVVINYDDASGSTESVTAGHTNELKTFYCYKHGRTEIPERLARVVALASELEDLFRSDALDIEFCITREDELYLFQVRPLTCAVPMEIPVEVHRAALGQIRSVVEEKIQPHPYLHGTRTVFGVMPDWNPAEIIGVRPRPLSLSLYRELVTDSIWAYQRDNYGYKNLRSFPLLLSFSGVPYIDVRVSFNSFIPADVSSELSERLTNYYIDRLIASPSYHDKVEFEIIFSCYTLDLQTRLAVLGEHGFSAEDRRELSDRLRELTNKIIHAESGLWRKDVEKIGRLESRRKAILDSGLDKIGKIYWLIEDCKRYGTLPFAGLARAGFIAVQLLKSLVNVGILSHQEYEYFMGQLDTVSSRMTKDFRELGKDAFLERYGHLRPGTYDILSPRYDEEPDRYFDWSKPGRENEAPKTPFRLSLKQLKRTEQLLKEHSLDHDVLGLFDFIKSAIEGREFAKFVFSRSLSDVLSLIKQLGSERGLTVEDCSYLEIGCLKELYVHSGDASLALRQCVDKGRAKYEITQHINLPPLITNVEDVFAFHMPSQEPNYITLKSATGHVVRISEDGAQLAGCILLIPSADPGFDWIFSHGIAGFVTMYGGANSHMAIRAGELGIPAVIGAGETLFARWSRAGALALDCANRQVSILR